MGDYLMSLIKANNITNTTGGIPTVKGQRLIPTAWVNFNGTVAGSVSGTVAIRDSEGVSSIGDLATGQYTINLSAAMSNADYAVTASAGASAYRNMVTKWNGTPTTTSFNVGVLNVSAGANYEDDTQVSVIVMGGQA